ncbi:MAG: hypothetical protein Q8N18_12660 [Opitutaceae bacterium]|nr:hypothetical protein [Opitutaceae bacterium]
MKTPPALLAVSLCASATLLAQSAAPVASSTTTAPASAEEKIVLSPFEVNSGDDKGYAASSALAGTRTNEKLRGNAKKPRNSGLGVFVCHD